MTIKPGRPESPAPPGGHVGGEKSLTALSFIFSIQMYGQPLLCHGRDRHVPGWANVERVAKLIKQISGKASS